MTNELKREFDRYKPWITKFTIQGQDYGGAYDAAGDPRVKWFHQHFPEAHNILELGSLEGGHSFALASLPHVTRVVAVEGRKDNLRRAQFVQGVLAQPKVSFVHENLERFNLSTLGEFDVVVCLGLLYHLPEPWKLVEQMSRVARAIYLWTHYADAKRAKTVRQHYQGCVYREWYFLFEALSGLSATSFWPTREGLLQMLADYGFADVAVVDDTPSHQHGPAITLVARRR